MSESYAPGPDDDGNGDELEEGEIAEAVEAPAKGNSKTKAVVATGAKMAPQNPWLEYYHPRSTELKASLDELTREDKMAECENGLGRPQSEHETDPEYVNKAAAQIVRCEYNDKKEATKAAQKAAVKTAGAAAPPKAPHAAAKSAAAAARSGRRRAAPRRREMPRTRRRSAAQGRRLERQGRRARPARPAALRRIARPLQGPGGKGRPRDDDRRDGGLHDGAAATTAATTMAAATTAWPPRRP